MSSDASVPPGTRAVTKHARNACRAARDDKARDRQAWLTGADSKHGVDRGVTVTRRECAKRSEPRRWVPIS
jgi:hypothetical protein